MMGSKEIPLLPARSLLHILLLLILLMAISSSDAFVVPGSARTPRTTTTTTTPSMGVQRPRSTSTALPASSSRINKVFVAGGSKGVGRCIIDKLVANGKQVVALVRNPDVHSELNQILGVTSILGDAFIIKDVENAMDGCDAAITTLGGTTKDAEGKDQRVDYVGNNHVIESAGILGVTRVILVTSIGCGDSKNAAPPNVFAVLKDVLAAKERAENVLIKYYTNTNWTIIRPGGLKSEPATGRAILTEDNTVIGAIHREDVADLVVKALEVPGTYRKILSALDPTVSSLITEVEGQEKQIVAFAL